MSSTLRPYVVKQGDYLLSLAARYGFDPEAVWSEPKNSALKELRKGDGNLLSPGDLLYIPEAERKWLPVKVGETNSFVAPSGDVHVTLTFVAEGKALAGEPYVVEGAAVDPGTLDGDGKFHARVSTRVTLFKLLLTNRNETYSVRVGHLDPAEEPSGMRMRLGMLGFYGRGHGACADEEGDLEIGVRLFQAKNDLPVTGELDDATVKAVAGKFDR